MCLWSWSRTTRLSSCSRRPDLWRSWCERCSGPVQSALPRGCSLAVLVRALVQSSFAFPWGGGLRQQAAQMSAFLRSPSADFAVQFASRCGGSASLRCLSAAVAVQCASTRGCGGKLRTRPHLCAVRATCGRSGGDPTITQCGWC
eukprot:UN1462